MFGKQRDNASSVIIIQVSSESRRGWSPSE